MYINNVCLTVISMSKLAWVVKVPRIWAVRCEYFCSSWLNSASNSFSGVWIILSRMSSYNYIIPFSFIKVILWMWSNFCTFVESSFNWFDFCSRSNIKVSNWDSLSFNTETFNVGVVPESRSAVGKSPEIWSLSQDSLCKNSAPLSSFEAINRSDFRAWSRFPWCFCASPRSWSVSMCEGVLKHNY